MTDSPEEEAALEADAKAYHADDLVNQSQLALWLAYCDKKMELEAANDRIEQLEAALREIAELNLNHPAAMAIYIARAALGEK
jgi:hypothetical protein